MSRQQGSARLGWTTAYVAASSPSALCSRAASTTTARRSLERAHHEGYWTWKAGGASAHKLGVVGSSMMVLMLGYSLRKRWRTATPGGAQPLARRAHLPGRVRTAAGRAPQRLQGAGPGRALSFWSMIVVAFSGVLGRYLYLQIPRTRAGEALALDEIERQDHELSQRLRAELRPRRRAARAHRRARRAPRTERARPRRRAACSSAARLRAAARRFRPGLPGVPAALPRLRARGAAEGARAAPDPALGPGATSCSITGTSCTSRSRW